jgi:hypothetical protein
LCRTTGWRERGLDDWERVERHLYIHKSANASEPKPSNKVLPVCAWSDNYPFFLPNKDINICTWLRIVEGYSKRTFGLEEDRPKAILSAALRVERFLDQIQAKYFEESGLFTFNLRAAAFGTVAQLLWCPVKPKRGGAEITRNRSFREGLKAASKVLRRSPSPSGSLSVRGLLQAKGTDTDDIEENKKVLRKSMAPSWSWISYHGPVSWQWIMDGLDLALAPGDTEIHYYGKIRTSNPYLSILERKKKVNISTNPLRGRLSFPWEVTSINISDLVQDRASLCTLTNGREYAEDKDVPIGVVALDASDELKPKGTYFAISLCQGYDTNKETALSVTYVLLVEPVDMGHLNMWGYRRVGVGIVFREGFFDDARLESIRIC